ncbi:MAG: T9SS type A sorting domain-containing protein [Bacteroidales bacterium]|nr:T9SS type A sorting domain-containing protein [Bacteroidales bacterium]
MKKTLTFLLWLLLILPGLVLSQGIRVKPGTEVTVNNGTTLKVSAGGDLLLEDDYSFSPSLLERGSVVFTPGGEARVQQYLEKDEWHIVSSAMADETIEAYLWMFLYQWNEPTAIWTNLFQPLTIPLVPGIGYHVWPYTSWTGYPPSPDSVEFNGTLNKASIPLSLYYSTASAETGWNLIGNPFPCAVDWNGHADWSLVNIDATVYFYDHGGSGQYATWNYNTGIGTNGKYNGYIPATQGLWVKANAASPSLTIPASQRLHSDTTEFFKGTKVEQQVLRLLLTAGNRSAETVIAFLGEATAGFDTPFDAHHMKGRDDAPQLFSELFGTGYAVNFLPQVEGHDVVPVTFIPAEPGVFSITVKGTNSFAPDIPIWLRDKKEAAWHDLRLQPHYSFTGAPEDEPERFEIWFAWPQGIDENLQSGIHIYSWEKTVYVHLPQDITGDIMLYDMPGQLIASVKGLPGLNTIPVSVAGSYILVQVRTADETVVKKVMIP